MIGIFLFVGFLFGFVYFYLMDAKKPLSDILTCEKCGSVSNIVELIQNKCPMCGGEVSLYNFNKPVVYTHPTDFRDLKEYNWWDFHDGSGQRVYSEGSLPTFGLWTSKDNLRAPHCLQAKFNWRFNSPCNDPHRGIINALPFPAECKSGKCRIRGPLEDNIKII